MLTYQLAFSLPPTKFHIQSAHGSHAERSNSFSINHSVISSNRLIIDPILAIMEPILPMAIVIDAIDECDEKIQSQIFIEIISDTITFHSNSSSQVESRKHIWKKFELSVVQPVMHLLALQDFQADADIHLFF